MKKKFHQTKLGKLIGTKLAKAAIKSIPIVGDILGPILDDTTRREAEPPPSDHVGGNIRVETVVEGSEAGTITTVEVVPILIKVGLWIVAILVTMGKISQEAAEWIKGFVT